MNKKNAIRLLQGGRFFIGWHKFRDRQGDRAEFHRTDMRVFITGLDDDLDRTVIKLKARGNKVEIVQVEWNSKEKNFVVVDNAP